MSGRAAQPGPGGVLRPVRCAGHLTTALSLLIVSMLGGCGGDDEVDPDDPAIASDEPVPSAEEAFALPLSRLRAIAEQASRRAEASEGSERGVGQASEAAVAFRVLALRDPSGDWLERARASYRSATRRAGLPGACGAGVALARLEAVDAGDPPEAYRVAYRTVRRFEDRDDADPRCLIEARRIMTVLSAYRPAAAELASIDADPDADDPSAAVGDAEAAGDDTMDVESWASGRGELADATLERVSVYGADAPGEGDTAGTARVVLRFDRVAVFRRGELEEDGDLPRRAYLDFGRTTAAEGVEPVTRVGRAGVERVRVGPFEPGVTRVVFDLQPEARYALFFLSDPYRVVVDFAPGGEAAPVAPPDESGGRELEVVVLDPGHGGDDHGARHGDLEEKDLTLDIAERVAPILRRRLTGARVLLTRHTDDFVSLEQRVAFANAVSADAFISIHLNSADEFVRHGGVATFVLDTTDDEQALRLAARENGTNQREVTGLQRLLATLHRDEQLDESRALAALVQRGTVTGGRRVLRDLTDRGVKSAMFYVLVGARMPAVLVEASFLTQPREAEALATPRYRQSLAEGIAEGIVRYARQ